MKKILALVLAVLMMATAVHAAQLPAALTEQMTNYTADYTFSITFDSSQQIAALLEEIDFPEEVSYIVDLEALLRTLLSYEGKMHMQGDISDDYQKIKLALTSDSVHSVDVNTNLNIGVNSKLGMWLDVDLTNDAAPVFDIIYSHPFLNKYLKIDGAAVIAEEEGAFDMLKSLFNKETLDSIQKDYIDMFAKYAAIEGSGNKFTVKIDNDGFTAIIDEVMLMIPEMMDAMVPGEDFSEYLEMPSAKGWQILGEDGLEVVYTLSGGKLKSEEMKLDISLDMAQIYEAVSGDVWAFETPGEIDFSINVKADVSAIGSTKVEFPVLTDENSFSLDELAAQQAADVEPAEPDMAYPLWIVSADCDYLHVADGEIYVPFRQAIECAFEDTAAIGYDNGKITVSGEYVPELELAIDSDAAYADGAAYTIAKPVLVNGTTYVSSSFFTDVLGWEFGYANHNMTENIYTYTFYTSPF